MKISKLTTGASLLGNAISASLSTGQHIFHNDEIPVEVYSTLPDSFIDDIYGGLVNTPVVVNHRLRRLNTGQLTFGNEFQALSRRRNRYQPYEDAVFGDYPYDSYAEAYFLQSTNLLKQNQIKYPDDDNLEDMDSVSLFGGIVTFAHFPTKNCFANLALEIDIAIVGAPFDTGVSYRTSARFGPNVLRQASRRLGQGLTPVRGKKGSKLSKVNPYETNLTIIDCGDIPMTPFDNRLALNQLYRGERAIHRHPTSNRTATTVPKIITLGGDHTITLMALKSSFEKHGPVTVLHFDSHIDTWDPKVLGGGITKYSSLNHGTFLHYAHELGYLAGKNWHLGLRAPLIVAADGPHDVECGFNTITAREIDTLGAQGIAKKIMASVGTSNPVYISVDIDVLDPAFAPGTGTAEPGGWSTRELLTVLDALEGLNVIGADVVEVGDGYEDRAGTTGLAGTAVIDSILGLMVVDDYEV
ncbi:hypothetical protein BABINDRAFT_161612 [Babjeviella inositovora NRRL Y-12698]|uniref:Agmatinase n=1 Tax=Babjeviella inositovora NRRL Y-12698 TaxID=984486 RepID=A0A1E3QQN7_9ASCO|nr:uncharacterized protein BABINDRAFT_161612 [Babjeviella inositovora NRRL Y-12698]ODQ79948.1 hypothetical protein BABINDRAFT_161612 [Babjeviella inositovora NRRL Y-12698]